jgi:hypothetical protein
VIAAASAHVLPYAGRTNPHGAEDRSWRAFLDYLDEVGGSQKADALFLRYVRFRNESDFSDRFRTRELYSTMVAVGGEWKPPLVIRERMAAWDFATAALSIDQAESVAQTRDSMERVLEPLHLKAPARLQSDYEYRNSLLDAVSREATVDLTAAKALVAASAAVHGHHGFFATIGLIGAKQNADLARARDSFVAGDGVKSRGAANDAARVVADAEGAGKLRLGGAAGLVVVLVLLVWALRGWRRRRRARHARQADAALASSEPWVPTPPAVGSTEPWSLPTVPVYVGAGSESRRPPEGSPELVGEPGAPPVAHADGHGDQPTDDAEPGFGG